MEENVIQINGGMTINVDVKSVMYAKKIMFGILLHVVVKMENIQQVLGIIQQLCLTKLWTHTTTKLKRFQQKLAKRKQPAKGIIFILQLDFS